MTYAAATKTLNTRLDPGRKVLAVQDFRHAVQGEGEMRSDFIRRVDSLYRISYGSDGLGRNRREAFLMCQLQEGLKYELVKSPAVSGANSYTELYA